MPLSAQPVPAQPLPVAYPFGGGAGGRGGTPAAAAVPVNAFQQQATAAAAQQQQQQQQQVQQQQMQMLRQAQVVQPHLMPQAQPFTWPPYDARLRMSLSHALSVSACRAVSPLQL